MKLLIYFGNFNSTAVIFEWINNFISYFKMYAISYPRPDESQSMSVKGAPGDWWVYLRVLARVCLSIINSITGWEVMVISTDKRMQLHLSNSSFRADSMFAPSQWETALLSNDVSHWLGTNLESALSLLTPWWKGPTHRDSANTWTW